MTKKITVSERYDEVITFLEEECASDELVTFVKERKAMHEKKNGSAKAKANPEREALLEKVCDYIVNAGRKVSVSDIIKNVPECAGMSTPKVSSLVTMLKKACKVSRYEEKGKALFTQYDATADE